MSNFYGSKNSYYLTYPAMAPFTYNYTELTIENIVTICFV
ncbi:hypothetical protein PLIP_b0670 [Pseudoalteromonas lipolytica LMEB 39]|nr:hypothetical protein [Pseudoalteromonas lipolytica LMEB 39]